MTKTTWKEKLFTRDIGIHLIHQLHYNRQESHSANRIPNGSVMLAVLGHKGGLTNPYPGAEDVEPVVLIPVDLPSLSRGHRDEKKAS